MEICGIRLTLGCLAADVTSQIVEVTERPSRSQVTHWVPDDLSLGHILHFFVVYFYKIQIGFLRCFFKGIRGVIQIEGE